MTYSVNRLTLIGNVGKEPESRQTISGDFVSEFSVATGSSWTDRSSGQKKEHTEWHRIVCWGKLAEIARDYLSKGRQVYIEGELKTEEFTGKDGTKQRSTKVIASKLLLLGPKEEAPKDQHSPPQKSSAPAARNTYQPAIVTYEDDLPF